MDTEALLKLLPATLEELVRRCGEVAAGRGERAYLVGGGLRDLVLGRPCEDVDVVVQGDGLAVAQAIARERGAVLTRYHAFQTARVDLPDGTRLDVATARSEEYPKPGDLPRVQAGTLLEDLARRDFTINTLALELGPDEVGQLVDPFDGLGDLDRRLIRTLHERSFTDDPTRMLRAVRFALRLASSLEPRTETALRAAVQGRYLDQISGHRLRRELEKLFTEAPVDGPIALRDCGLLEQVDPDLVAGEKTLLALQRVLAWTTERGDPLESALGPTWTLVLTVAAAGMAPQARWRLVRRLELPRPEQTALIDAGGRWAEVVDQWRRGLSDGRLSEMLDPLSAGALAVSLAALGTGKDSLAEALRSYLAEWRWITPELDGEDLLEIGYAPGPAIGEALRRLRRARIEKRASDTAGERALALEWLTDRAN